MSYGKNLDILFVIGFFSIVTISSCWTIIELEPSKSSLTIPSLNIAFAIPSSNNTNNNTTLISSNLTNTTIVKDSNGTLTTIPELNDRRHAPLR